MYGKFELRSAKLATIILTLVTATKNCSCSPSSLSKMSNIVSKLFPHTNRSSALSAFLNELVHGQSHVTGLYNIGDRVIVYPFEVCRLS